MDPFPRSTSALLVYEELKQNSAENFALFTGPSATKVKNNVVPSYIESNPDISVEKFEKFRQKFVGYTYADGDSRGLTALGAAAITGNTQLISHLVEKGGPTLLELADGRGFTPLILTCCCTNKTQGYQAAKKLIELGANVLFSTKKDYRRNDYGVSFMLCSAFSTPLEIALEGTTNLLLIQCLLLNGGGVRHHSLSEEGQMQFEEARNLLFERPKLLLIANQQKKMANDLPLEVTKKIIATLITLGACKKNKLSRLQPLESSFKAFSKFFKK